MDSLLVNLIYWAGILKERIFNYNILSLSCITLLFALLQIVWIRKLRLEQRLLQEEIEETISELHETRKDYQYKNCENNLISEFFKVEDHSKALRILLKRYLPETKSGITGFIFFEKDESVLLSSRGMSNESIGMFNLDNPLIQKVKKRNVVILKDKQLRASEFYRSLSSNDRIKTKILYLFDVSTDKKNMGIFFTTSLYPVIGSIEKQTAFAKQILSFLAVVLKRTLEFKENQKELKYTKEILELLAITDNQELSPMEMTQKFLELLTVRLHAERISTYVSTSDIQNPVRVLVRSGHSEQVNIQKRWEEYEDELALLAIQFNTGISLDTPTLRDCGIRAIIRSAMTFPMIHKSTRIGEMIITRKEQHDFSVDEFELAEWACEHLASTISRIISQATVAKQARVDQLTQLSNRREFDEEIIKALKQASQNGQDCSLLFCDLDHFKLVNDTYGHLTGDTVLKGTADIIKEEIKKIRSSDRAIMARFGGEEFAILLPGVSSQGAFRIAETIRKRIEEKEYSQTAGNFNATISIGIGIYPTQANTVDELISAADSAVYRAKKEGRNCVAQLPIINRSTVGSHAIS